jgi:putative ABC transport system permease protein
MLRLILTSARGHLVRFLLTAFSVMLGVSFVTGTFVLSDSIDTALQGLLTNTQKGLDVGVRGIDAGTNNSGGSRAALPLTLQQDLAAVPGVARVSPDLQGTALIAGKDGIAVGGNGAPGLGFAFEPDSPAFTLVKGTGPTGPDQVAVESSTLTKSGLAVGDTTQAVIGDQTRTVTISGEVKFGSLFGATAVLLDDATARAAFAPDGTVPSFSITADRGVTQKALQAGVAAVLPPTAEAVTGATLADETAATLATGLGFFTTFLLVFAAIALFVGSFIIVNTFSMLVAQRTRELALLRAVGASRGQVLRLVLGEAVVVGILGSGLGLGLGLLIAGAAQWLIRTFVGADIGSDLPLSVSTVVWSLVVGTVVTVVAALLPARRAARTAPVTAMRADLSIAAKGLRLRGAVGAALLAAGGLLLAFCVTRANPAWTAAGIGAGLAVIGVLVAAPLAARPVVRVIAWPFVALGGLVGKLARENALRVPRRTANTASALMIGLALIAGLSVLAQSVKASVADGVTRELTADFVLNGATAAIPSTIGPAVAELTGVSSVTTISRLGVQIGDFGTSASATSARDLAENVVVTIRSGRLDALAGNTVLVDQSTATAQGWQVGTRLDSAVGTLTNRTLTIGGIFSDSQAFGSHLIVDRALYQQAVPAGQRTDSVVYVKAGDGADLGTLRTELVGIVKPYLVVSVQNRQEFIAATGSSINTLLNLLYVLLLFSVIVAILGIVNTLALSVFERTREIGLLRAIGLRRRQLSSMITIEAIATALFGAILGTMLGLGLGIALQQGLKSQGLEVLAISWPTIIVMLVVSAVVGILAAVLPSIRAVRLNILTAIAADG